MTSLEVTVLEPFAAGVITRRAGSGASVLAIAAAARRAYDELAVVLVPIIRQAGADALIARELHLTKRQCPDPETREAPAEPFGVWLDRQYP